jgi:hypothetical protein
MWAIPVVRMKKLQKWPVRTQTRAVSDPVGVQRAARKICDQCPLWDANGTIADRDLDLGTGPQVVAR